MKNAIAILKQMALYIVAMLITPVRVYAERNLLLYAGQNNFTVQYPTMQDFMANAVGINGKVELIWQPLYDWNIYPTAGIAALPFFATPQGQGFSAQPIAAAAPKTIHDTNLTQAGMLPAPQSFWVDGIEICIDPGSTATANLFGNAVPTTILAAQAAASTPTYNDYNIIARSGLLTFSIMQKNYYQEGPLYRFPQRSFVKNGCSLASTSATAASIAIQEGHAEGVGVRFDPGYGIATTCNFGVTINWPANVVTTAPGSGFNARIGCFLNGWLFRAAQ